MAKTVFFGFGLGLGVGFGVGFGVGLGLGFGDGFLGGRGLGLGGALINGVGVGLIVGVGVGVGAGNSISLFAEARIGVASFGDSSGAVESSVVAELRERPSAETFVPGDEPSAPDASLLTQIMFWVC